MEKLLEKAKQMFPIGTIYNNSNLIPSGKNRVVANIPYIEGSNIRVREGYSDRWLYLNGSWAKIIELPENCQLLNEPSYEIY